MNMVRSGLNNGSLCNGNLRILHSKKRHIALSRYIYLNLSDIATIKYI